jgi:ADP-ribose pyrophosphatase YjhB (NUDIX family)
MTENYNDFINYPTGKIKKGKFCECCGRFNNRVVTSTMLGVKNGKLLMILRKLDPQKGFWAIPGGYLDWGETVEECAVREFEEESGYGIGKLKYLGVYSRTDRDLDGRQNVDHSFYGEVGNMVGRTDDFEIEMVKWFELDKLPDKIAFDHRKMIGDFLKRIKKGEFDGDAR